MLVYVIEAVAALVIILCAVDGWNRGLLLKLFGFLRFLLMIALTVVLTPVIYRFVQLEPGIREGASVLIALVLSVVLLAVLSKVLKIVDKIPVLKQINRVGGALVGLVFGVVAVWVILLLLSSFTEIEWCRNVIGYVRQSPLLMWLLHFNPISILK